MNLKSWIVEYYTVYKAFDLKASTRDSYLRILSQIPNDWEYETVRLADIQLLINSLSAHCAPSTVKHVFQIIREPLENGYLFGYEDRRGMLNAVRLPKMRRALVRPLSAAELARLHRFIPLSVYADIYTVLLGTGMRFCELSGLNCSDYVPEENSVFIQRDFYRGYLNDYTKTSAGMRVIPLKSGLKSIFNANMRIGTPNEPLFLSARNNRLSYNTIVHDWHKVCKVAKVRQCGLHVFRHTFATQMLESGAPMKVVSAILGHNSIAVTADIYCDVTMSAKREAMQMMEAHAHSAAKPHEQSAAQ